MYVFCTSDLKAWSPNKGFLNTQKCVKTKSYSGKQSKSIDIVDALYPKAAWQYYILYIMTQIDPAMNASSYVPSHHLK